MFYDNLTGEACGIFTPWHFVAIAVFLVGTALTVYCTRHIKHTTVKTVLLVSAIAVTAMEIIKIAIRLYRGLGYDTWLPLYFCSLFIYAVWLCFVNNEFVQNMGYSFLFFGGVVAALAFIIYPSTSLLYYSLWHPASLHSLTYHAVMLYCGLIVVISGVYKPRARHFLQYFLFVTVFAALSLLANQLLATNMMFMGKPFAIAFLQAIYDVSPVLYAVVVYLALAVGVFWAVYGIYRGINALKKRKSSPPCPSP